MDGFRITRKLSSLNFHRLLMKRLPMFQTITPTFFSSQEVPSVPEKPKSDHIILALRSARSTSDILSIVKIHSAHMSAEHAWLSMRMLSTIQKTNSVDVRDVLNSNEFLLLCRRLKKLVSVFDVREVLDALKTVTMFKVPHNSVITQQLLHIMKKEVNALNINQIVFLSYLLRQYPSSPIVDALLIALPIVFETQLKIKLDRSSVTALVDALVFCCKNKISRESTDFVIDALLALDQLDWVTMDPRKAKSITLAIADMQINSPACETVFRDAADVFAQNLHEFSFSEVDVVLGAIVKRIRRIPYLNHAKLFESVLENAVESNWNMNECSIILRKIGPMGFVNRRLLDVMANKILDDPEGFRTGKFGLVKAFVQALSLANYKTEHWNLLKDLLPTSTCFRQVEPKEPWIPLCLELASLDIFQEKLISQVFSPWFLGLYLSREYNKLDLLQLLRLYQTVKTLFPTYSGPWPDESFLRQGEQLNGANIIELPLQGALQMILGSNAVLSRCRTSLGHFLDHVVVLHPSGKALTYTQDLISQNSIMLDNLTIPPDCQRVAIFFHPKSSYNSIKQLRGLSQLNIRVVENMGFTVVNISAESWSEMPNWEKCPYLLQQIQLKCNLLQKHSVLE